MNYVILGLIVLFFILNLKYLIVNIKKTLIVTLLFLLYLILSIYNYPFEYRYSTIMVYIKIFLLILIIIYFDIRKKHIYG